MHPLEELAVQPRRDILATSGNGVGLLAPARTLLNLDEFVTRE